MGQLYLEFDEKELKKNLELFERIQNEKNGDLEEAFKLFADKYINDEMDLAVFLQVINKLYRDIHIIGDISLYQQLLEGIEKVKKYKVKKYVEEKNCKIGIINIYEILIDIYDSMYDFNNVYELSKELLSIDESNKIALLNLSKYEGEGENKKLILNYSIDDLAILNNLANYYSKNNEIDRAIEYNKIIISLTKDGNYLKEILPYNYMWGYYYISNTQNYLPIAQSNLGDCYHTKYREDKDIENRRKAENLYKKSIKNYKEFYEKYGIQQPYIKDPIINLANLYYEEEKYEEAHKLINEYPNWLPKDSDYYMLKRNDIYRENPCEKTAKEALEFLKNSIRELNFIDSSSFEAAIQGALLYTIPLMYEMQEKKHIHYDAAKESLNQLYVYNAEKPNFNLQALLVSFKIKDYELCSKIALNIINNYPLDKEGYKMVLEYLIISLHRLNKDNSKNLLSIFNDKDFNNYEYIVKLINECAEFEVLDNSIEIKNKKVLISLYEIMSFSRKELIVMRLFDYIRNADAYANMKINNDTEELETDRIARWKGDNVEIKNEYILCYHFHSSSEIQYKKDEHGNFQLNEKGEKIPIRISVRGERRKTIWRKFPAENWIAVNQIRDTLAHRINENDTDVNEAIRTTKNAREFIEANFTSIIECLFNVIKENNLLSDSKFDSEDF